jgi:hypothetical protein
MSSLGKPGYRQKDNLKMDLTEIGMGVFGLDSCDSGKEQ